MREHARNYTENPEYVRKKYESFNKLGERLNSVFNAFYCQSYVLKYLIKEDPTTCSTFFITLNKLRLKPPN